MVIVYNRSNLFCLEYICTGVACFILPKLVIRKINSILASFLWADEVKQMYGARVC